MSPTNPNEFDFDADPTVREKTYKITGKTYTLREADEETSIKFRGMQLKNAKMVDGKISANIENVYESQSFLVSRCLYDSDNKLVTLPFLRSLAARIVKRIYQDAKEISDLSETETKEDLEKRIESDKKKLDELERGITEGKGLQTDIATTIE